MTSAATLAVKPSRQFPFLARHPWVHAASLIDIDPGLPRGAVVDLTTHDGHWIGRGLYNPNSGLRVRLYSWNRDLELDAEFFRRRIEEAIQRRACLGLGGADQAVRLVYSEADGLSGLIVDRYANTLVIQLTAAAIEEFLPPLVQYLQETLQPRAIVLRTDPKLQAAENFSLESSVIYGALDPEHPVAFRQNELHFEVDLVRGQKTGAYLDQRDNHAAAARYLTGRTVLDMCCHTGGFGLVAAARGAAEVLGVDSSQQALAAARRNADRNQLSNLQFETGDCFDTLAEMAKSRRKFGAVVVDPPRLAGSRAKVESALRAYYRLNRSAIDLLEPGGILVTCSCSGRVTRGDFLNTLVDVGRRGRRDITVLENRGAAPDHPMRVSCPESDYLKCLICEVR
ncbi:class I SAM-dependent rRNA methyltransferase [Planctomycetaceae bacterium SH139]